MKKNSAVVFDSTIDPEIWRLEAELQVRKRRIENIRAELRAVEKYMLRGIDQLGDESPKSWQVFSKFSMSIPEEFFITEESVLDLIGYFVLRLVDARHNGAVDWTLQQVAEVPPAKLPRITRKRIEKSVGKRTLKSKIAKRKALAKR
jgi:hypothetical protein